MVKNAVVPLRMPSILEVAPSDANAKSVNGNALLTTAIIRMLGKYDLNLSLFCLWSSKGINTRPAIKSLNVTKRIGPKSTAEIFINMKALPHIAASEINKTQSLDSILQMDEIRIDEF